MIFAQLYFLKQCHTLKIETILESFKPSSEENILIFLLNFEFLEDHDSQD